MSERVRVATLQRHGGNEVAFVASFVVNVFNEPADFYEIYCDVEESWRFCDTRGDKWTARDKWVLSVECCVKRTLWL